MEFEVYITRHALSKGIMKKTVVNQVGLQGMVCDVNSPRDFYVDGEWHDSLVFAVEAAYAMKFKKIKSLEDDLEKTRALSFDSEASLLLGGKK